MKAHRKIPMISSGRYLDRGNALTIRIPEGRETLRRIQRLLLLVAAIGVLLPAGPAGADVGDVLDQSQTIQNSQGMIGSGEYRAGEVFTVGMYGILDRVSVVLANYAADPATGPINVSIQRLTEDGLPSGSQIGSGTIPQSAIPPAGSPAWVDAAINPIKVTPGTKYAILLSTSGGIVMWGMGSGGVKPYPEGYWVDRPTDTWEKILTYQDWTFKTYVWPPIPDQSQAVHNRYNQIGGGNRLAQTFTAGQFGLLDQVSVLLENWQPDPTDGDITVTIQTVLANGQPSGEEISFGTIPFSAIPPSGSLAWVDVFMSDTLVVPGNRYALVLSLNSGGYVWWADNTNGDIYPGGSEMIHYATGGWGTLPSYDTAFKTYVMPSTIDQSQPAEGAYTEFGGILMLGQSFTAGRSGYLDRLDLGLGNVSAAGPVIVSIRTMTGDGYPSGTEIGSGSIPLSAWPTALSRNVQNIVINGGAYVIAGTQYAIVLSIPAGGTVRWWSDCCQLYAGGVRFEGYLPADWTIKGLDLFDNTFTTYVVPAMSIPGQPGPGNPPFTPADAIQLIGALESSIADPAQIVTSDLGGANLKVKENRREALLNKLDAVIASIDAATKSAKPAGSSADYQGAINQLKAILDKTDGCVLRGTPDTAGSGFTPDWLVTCPSQALIDPFIRSTISILEGPSE